MLSRPWVREGLQPLHRARQSCRKSRGQNPAARLSKDENCQSVFKESRRFRLSPELVVKEWSQFPIIWRVFFLDVQLFGEKRDMLRFHPELQADPGIGAVQSLQNGQREQEIPQRPLVDDGYLPGLSPVKGTHALRPEQRLVGFLACREIHFSGRLILTVLVSKLFV